MHEGGVDDTSGYHRWGYNWGGWKASPEVGDEEASPGKIGELHQLLEGPQRHPRKGRPEILQGQKERQWRKGEDYRGGSGNPHHPHQCYVACCGCLSDPVEPTKLPRRRLHDLFRSQWECFEEHWGQREGDRGKVDELYGCRNLTEEQWLEMSLVRNPAQQR